MIVSEILRVFTSIELKKRISILMILVFITGAIRSYCQSTGIDALPVSVKDSVMGTKRKKIVLTNYMSVIEKSRRQGRAPSMLTFKYGNNGKDIEIGSTGQKLRPYISDCPAAVVELDSFKMEIRKERRLTAITVGLMVSTLGVTIIYAVNVRSSPWVPVIGEAVLGCASLVPIAVNHPKIDGFDQIRRCVEEYNKWVGP